MTNVRETLRQAVLQVMADSVEGIVDDLMRQMDERIHNLANREYATNAHSILIPREMLANEDVGILAGYISEQLVKDQPTPPYADGGLFANPYAVVADQYAPYQCGHEGCTHQRVNHMHVGYTDQKTGQVRVAPYTDEQWNRMIDEGRRPYSGKWQNCTASCNGDHEFGQDCTDTDRGVSP